MGDEDMVSPQGGAEWDVILQPILPTEERLSHWNKAFNLSVRVLHVVCREQEIDGGGFSLSSRNFLTSLPALQQFLSWEITILQSHVCLLISSPFLFIFLLLYLTHDLVNSTERLTVFIVLWNSKWRREKIVLLWECGNFEKRVKGCVQLKTNWKRREVKQGEKLLNYWRLKARAKKRQNSEMDKVVVKRVQRDSHHFSSTK